MKNPFSSKKEETGNQKEDSPGNRIRQSSKYPDIADIIIFGLPAKLEIVPNEEGVKEVTVIVVGNRDAASSIGIRSENGTLSICGQATEGKENTFLKEVAKRIKGIDLRVIVKVPPGLTIDIGDIAGRIDIEAIDCSVIAAIKGETHIARVTHLDLSVSGGETIVTKMSGRLKLTVSDGAVSIEGGSVTDANINALSGSSVFVIPVIEDAILLNALGGLIEYSEVIKMGTKNAVEGGVVRIAKSIEE